MKNDIGILIHSQFSEAERKFLTREIIDHVVHLYNEIAFDYEANVFERVHHVDLFFQKGFDSYIDSQEVCDQLTLELKKDSISIEEKHLLKIIRIIREKSRE